MLLDIKKMIRERIYFYRIQKTWWEKVYVIRDISNFNLIGERIDC